MQAQPFPASDLQNYEIRQRIANGGHGGYGENAPQARARQTAPCKHFVRMGYCPFGDTCNFIHDPSLSVIDTGKNPQLERHCWAHVQGGCCVRSCQYFHPYDIRPYKKYTPCYAWNSCPIRSSCPFRHPGQVVSPPAVETASTQQLVAPMMINRMSYPTIDPSSTSGSGPYHPSNAGGRMPHRDVLNVSSPAHYYGGIYAPPSSLHADPRMHTEHANSIAHLEALPGPSFEDSPPPIPSSRGHQKIYATTGNTFLPSSKVRGTYTHDNAVSYHQPHRGIGQAQSFDDASGEVGHTGALRTGQRGPSEFDNYRAHPSSQLHEDAQRKAAIRKQTFHQM